MADLCEMHTKIGRITHKKGGNTHKKKILNKVVKKYFSSQNHIKTHKNTHRDTKLLQK